MRFQPPGSQSVMGARRACHFCAAREYLITQVENSGCRRVPCVHAISADTFELATGKLDQTVGNSFGGTLSSQAKGSVERPLKAGPQLLPIDDHPRVGQTTQYERVYGYQFQTEVGLKTDNSAITFRNRHAEGRAPYRRFGSVS